MLSALRGSVVGIGVVLAIVSSSCAAGSDVDASSQSVGATTGSSTGGEGGTGGSSAGGGGAGNGGPGGLGGEGGTGNVGVGGAQECGETSSTATSELIPVDLIIAVDTSGSMAEGFPEGIGPSEISQVVSNLNAAAAIITNSGIDMHVIMIADSAVCIQGSLGSGSCPNDENLPAYRHVNLKVDSKQAYQSILNAYPDYSASLRPEAIRRVLVVTDDNDNMTSSSFISQLTALDSDFANVTVDSIVAFEGPVASCNGGCGQANHPCCPCFPVSPIIWPLSAASGTNYIQAATSTGGVTGDLCLQQFGPFFNQIGNAIVQDTPVSCEFEIPAPPMGETIDFGKVNVEYLPGGGQPDDIFNVADASSCGINGWYYDDPVTPTKIVLCPVTCNAVQADPAAQIKVLFGCETETVPN